MSRSDRITLAVGAGALILAVAAGWLILAPPAEPSELVAIPSPIASAHGAGNGGSGATTIVVDVEGAVANPGVQTLPAGSRVSDAIAAAGGYSAGVDVAAAASQINLAQPLTDGEQIHVPIQGEVAPGTGPPDATDGDVSGGLVDLNTASPEELEALPGIGPVTVQKIVAAREEQPFSSLQDAVDRGVLDRGQLEQIQTLATAG